MIPHSTYSAEGPLAIKAADTNKESTHSDAVRATPDNVARALESAVRLNFDRYYQKKQLRAKRRGMSPTP